MAFAVNDVVYVTTAVKADHMALQGSRYGRVLAVNPTGHVATYLVAMANNPGFRFIFDEASLIAPINYPASTIPPSV